MSPLHDRLREIILNFGMGMYINDPDDDTFTPVRWEESPLVDEMVEEIEQAVDNRFKTELDAEKQFMSPGEYKHALSAAERAAAIK